jgi:hypothetical protein
MKNSENKKSNLDVNYIPSCEINDFIHGVLKHKPPEQKYDNSERTDVKRDNKSYLPPSCEFDEPRDE